MKKLTAGIFTALLGLVTVNAANAAIPSTNYVNEHIDAVRSGYESADTALRARINGVESAYQAADSALDGRVTDLKTTVGEGTMVVATKTQADVITAINALDAKTNGIASNTALETLQNTVTGHGTDITDLKNRMGTAEGEIDALQAKDTELSGSISTNAQAITDNATATTNALALKADKSALGALAAKDTVATSDLDSTLQDAVAQVATNKSGIESLNTTVGTKAAQSDLTALTTRVATAEGSITALANEKADATYVTEQLAQKADVASVNAVAEKADNNETEIGKLGASKLDASEHEPDQVLITNADGDVTTSATITQGQVSGLTTALNGKMPLTTTDSANIGEDGTYVLTATTTGGVTTYKWEQIERSTPK